MIVWVGDGVDFIYFFLPAQNMHQSEPENLNIAQVHHTTFSIQLTIHILP